MLRVRVWAGPGEPLRVRPNPACYRRHDCDGPATAVPVRGGPHQSNLTSHPVTRSPSCDYVRI
jgi:hypothetical protein